MSRQYGDIFNLQLPKSKCRNEQVGQTITTKPLIGINKSFSLVSLSNIQTIDIEKQYPKNN